MTTEHTPTKWQIDGNCVYALNDQGYNRFSAWVQGGNTGPMEKTPDSELEANARLIAAAPELLEALESILPMLADWHDEFPDHVGDKEAPAVKAALTAIAKAKGEQQ
ncbi:hypothetical protein [Achromobacter xylosoxidans]|uniref:Uncharacterized protein n=1 Tax=Alcaligenes xylosoxydans xylosoxydans TaxID=85698 RepID=A0A424W575_ALCXX|nr:hypothetical protein [Achromobacter xylosoxidans]MBC9904794.1 hypothetical protein [Achromobacter xylosoxidans]MBD0868711.1 hypothetical protein [Achromobacter xylosoxidans]QNP87786.1 hypothetical protein IAG39_09870 [Achromobacter xylosoxidans]RPJ88439.1 hypothetical protein DY367_27925 [Achromobacter xylosoxidans]